MAKVYFASARAKYSESMPGKLERLLKEIGLMNYFSPKEWVAVKTHFGSEGSHRIVRPVFLRKVVDALKGVGSLPFVTDTVRIKDYKVQTVIVVHASNGNKWPIEHRVIKVKVGPIRKICPSFGLTMQSYD